MFQPLLVQGPADDPDVWRGFVDRLEERKLCQPGKASGLRAWLGWETIFDSDGTFTEYRTIHHFKFDLKGEEITARAYAFAIYAPANGRGGSANVDQMT